jgi:phospholipid transport system substrate-binding protein
MVGWMDDSRKAHHDYRGVLMEMSVRQSSWTARSRKGEFAKTVAGRGPTVLGWVILVLLVLGHGVHAEDKRPKGTNEQPAGAAASQVKEANDPNELWWSRWDAQVKDPNDPRELLAVKWDAVLKVLQAKDLDQKLKEKIIDRIVGPMFDFPLMGQLALGRIHWPKLDAAQREKFIRLFVARLKALYLEKTALYTNERFVLKPVVPKKNTVQIPMTLISEGKEIVILYKLHKLDEQSKSKANGRWRIYDVEIEGVSILLTYRSQFDDILRHGTVEDLLSQLEKSPKQ